MDINEKEMPYIYLEAGARGIADRAIRLAREGESMEMIKEFSLLKCYLDTILQKKNLTK